MVCSNIHCNPAFYAATFTVTAFSLLPHTGSYCMTKELIKSEPPSRRPNPKRPPIACRTAAGFICWSAQTAKNGGGSTTPTKANAKPYPWGPIPIRTRPRHGKTPKGIGRWWRKVSTQAKPARPKKRPAEAQEIERRLADGIGGPILEPAAKSHRGCAVRNRCRRHSNSKYFFRRVRPQWRCGSVAQR